MSAMLPEGYRRLGAASHGRSASSATMPIAWRHSNTRIESASNAGRFGWMVSTRELPTVAALFVEPRGSYRGQANVDMWPESRDARLYDGPYRVVAHPPCSRWCRLAALVERRHGHLRGQDAGCFASALASVRRWGGVLEHPAYSDAWRAYGLNAPNPFGGWVNADFVGGWTCQVEQGRYGHRAKKATWLYAYGVPLPSLRWGCTPDKASEALVSWCGNHGGAGRPRLTKREAIATPAAFRDVLLAIARG